MKISITTELGCHTREVKSADDLIKLMIELYQKVRFDDNNWKQ